MRDEDFKRRLSEVAEWEIPLTMESSEQGIVNKRRRLEREGSDGINQTYPPKILKIKHQPMPCGDCGKTVEGRCKEMQIYKNKSHVGTKERCVNCGLHKDPYTGEFTLTGTEASIKWNSYCRAVKKRYTAKVETKQDQTAKNPSIIRKYPETLDPL